ncbi:sulfopropanediol 3-dehydrogenase [Roseovarius azorensis]|uniref:Histidinol dehydrogenase homolog n=1 Tax=Roseovarius azorensis TaxID=1287727 RepID=A0A1H7UHL1_9RHOB|nr:histidinol dehydrogenase [Roseovarius azorensis]SEL96118.1 sulfopropanediol 3-dehydrogenase [Roseovarius azorensis]
MSVTHLKTAPGEPPRTAADVADTVQVMLARLRTGGAQVALEYARQLDGWYGAITVTRAEIDAAVARVPQGLKDDIGWAHDNISRFAAAQRATAQDMALELRPGLWAGQRQIPLAAAGCYVPGGRYSHIASALMSIATAREAGVPDITACSPPNGSQGIPDAMLYAMDLSGATRILTIGGVQGIAAMAFGLFGAPTADILVGPGNAYVAEAKRQLFGPIGIDMFAGPTDSLVLADDTADPETVAADLVGQAEHGSNSPVWLVTTHRPLADAVLARVPALIAELPEPNRAAATAAWRDLAEVALCDTPEDMAQYADAKAPEHLHVQARDLPWWRMRLRAYGSLFLGENTTVAFGDKAAGPNHVLPTSGAARYTGGLSVHKFLKTVTWQEVDARALPDLARVTASLSRAEGMEGHARSADIRLVTQSRTATSTG